MARIGLLGGSFNPAHRGHRHISLEARRALGLDEVWWLVSPGNPLKPKKGMAPYEARLASAEKMARRAPIRATDFEARVGTRYTIDTLRALFRHYPQHEFIWLVGEDIIAEFDRWKDWRAIARMLPIAVMTRPGYSGGARAARAMGWLRHFVRSANHAKRWTDWKAPAITFLTLAPDPTSATALRARQPDWHQHIDGPDEATARQRS